MPIADDVRDAQIKASMIRKMFEEGAVLKQRYGSDNVFDFSIGNPDVEPPPAFHEALKRFAVEPEKGKHAYMPNAGFPDVREKLAAKTAREQRVDLNSKHIVMTVGAAGGLNVVLKAVVNPGDTVIIPKPYFVEYGFYTQNHGGRPLYVDTTEDFDLDVDAIAANLTKDTAAVIINSPHNPTGRVYSAETIAALAEVLRAHGERTGRYPYLIADEPYRDIVYDGIEVPPILATYEHSFAVTSFSKTLSLPGERIGFIAAAPDMPDIDEVTGALTFANRVLGYVNAPALMQRVVGEIAEARVDISIYERRRQAFTDVLNEVGIEYAKPEGAFYLFCKVPPRDGKAPGGAAPGGLTVEDDAAFVDTLRDSLVLAVPGSGFGTPGWFRLSYCVGEEIVAASRGAFTQAVAAWQRGS